MNLPDIFKRVAKLTADNSPAVLSALAIGGTAATAYLTAKATFKAAEIIGDEAEKRILREIEETRVFPTKDKIKLVWTQYIPPAGMVITTIGCIVFANRINAKRMAGLVAAYSISEKRLSEYKEKALEKLGVNKEQAMRDEIAQDRVHANPPTGQIIMGGGEVLFMDSMSGRYFMSDVESVRQAVNNVNASMIHDMYTSLSDFYEQLGLAATKFSDDLGWTIENGPIQVVFSTTIADNNRPAMVMDFNTTPVPIRSFSFQG